MKLLALACLCLLPCAAAPTRPASGPVSASVSGPVSVAEAGDLLASLGWMEGRWTIDGDGQYIEETWSPARADAMVGSLRWAREGKVWLYELMSIEADEEHGLVLRLRHFDRGLKPWASEKDGPLTYPLAELSDGRAVFENPARDAPRRFVYERDGDTLTIRLEDPEGNDEHPFRFTR